MVSASDGRPINITSGMQKSSRNWLEEVEKNRKTFVLIFVEVRGIAKMVELNEQVGLSYGAEWDRA